MPGTGAMGRVADRVGALLRADVEFGRAGHELAGDGIVGIVRIDERGNSRRDRDRIAGRDGL